MPFRYLLSGGVSLRSLTPGWTYGLWRWVENRMQPWMNHWGMFAHIVLHRSERADGAADSSPPAGLRGYPESPSTPGNRDHAGTASGA